MLKWLAQHKPAVLCAFCLLLVLQSLPARSEPAVAFEITDIKSALAGNTLTYTISGTTPPVYTVSERFSPFRFLVDVAGAFLTKDFSSSKVKLPENSFSEVSVTDLKEQNPQVMRFEFSLADSHDYEVTTKDNDLQIKLIPANPKNSGTPAKNEGKGELLSLKDLKVTSTPTTTTISILASASIEKYKVDSIAGSADRLPRMFIDINDVKINELVKEKQIGTSVSKVRVSGKDKGARIVFDSANSQLFKYTVTPTATGLDVIIDESSVAPAPSKGQATEKSAAADTTLDSLIGSSQKLLTSGPEKADKKVTSEKIASLEKDFSLSGYNKQRISVDFYKIDIHNVFRLFRQITDLNIIVDEEVQGALTLALNDVPWDFALDIILNLMDLKKEERFNTIVIYPAKKAFAWPNRTEDNLSFEADVEVIAQAQETLVIEKSSGQTKEIQEAKELILKAQKHEELNEFENAAVIYTKALELWPQNGVISNRLAALYLVNLGVNAKAVFFAKQSLKHDPKNAHAALYAAIGLANMQQISEASDYFAQSISGTPPMKEALFNYAAFSENNGQNDAALKLFKKFESHYGETLDTMVAKARILDKQGLPKEATKQYQAILASGFQIRPDLKKYIEGRLAAKDLY